MLFIWVLGVGCWVCVSDGSGALFLNCTAFKGVQFKKKREHTARPVVFTKGHAHTNFNKLTK